MPFTSSVDTGQVQPWYLAWEGNVYSISTHTTLTANKTYLTGIVVTSSVVATGMRTRISTFGNGNFDLGIYDSNFNLLANIGKQTSTAGNTAINFTSGNLPLAPGRYYLAGWTDNATDQWYQAPMGGGYQSWVNAYLSTGTSSTGLPTTFSGSGNGVALCLQAVLLGGL